MNKRRKHHFGEQLEERLDPSRFALVRKLRERRRNHKRRSKFVRGATLVAGLVILFVGLLLLALPGPAFAVIPIGLYLLALEFHWAEQLLERALEHADNAKNSSFVKSVTRFVRRRPRLSALMLALFLTLVASFIASLFAFDLVPDRFRD